VTWAREMPVKLHSFARFPLDTRIGHAFEPGDYAPVLSSSVPWITWLRLHGLDHLAEVAWRCSMCEGRVHASSQNVLRGFFRLIVRAHGLGLAHLMSAFESLRDLTSCALENSAAGRRFRRHSEHAKSPAQPPSAI
jgi:hypothetical protein